MKIHTLSCILKVPKTSVVLRKYGRTVLTRKESIRMRQYREEHPQVTRALNYKYHLKKLYGITPEQYAEMYDRQDGKCAICGAPPTDKFRLGVDHNHSTKQIRGLLCHSCNTGLGLLGDSLLRLSQAWQYLTHFDKCKGLGTSSISFLGAEGAKSETA